LGLNNAIKIPSNFSYSKGDGFLMRKLCLGCGHIVADEKNSRCSECNSSPRTLVAFENNDELLRKNAAQILKQRKQSGLEGLVRGLDAIIINTEIENHDDSTQELLESTGHQYSKGYKTEKMRVHVLTQENSPNILVQTRLKANSESNPFYSFNLAPKTKKYPNTRLETFIFRVKDLEKYVSIQKKQGMGFLTNKIIHNQNYSFIQTHPSKYIHTSFGFIEWHRNSSDYTPDLSEEIQFKGKKPDWSHLKDIFELDHTATRVRAEERDLAILEFMKYTNYHFEFAIYVKHLNSITNVARLSSKDFAMVFTSGIRPFTDLDSSGPTERYTYNYNPRVHHMAFRTENIDNTFKELKKRGMKFLLELVGSPDDGLKQTFSAASSNTFIVNEYIHRYGDFTGFFTKSNVTDLTKATEKQ
jgi:4-hydroxyphenylpyruvate dioxygenase-like putative hemolysin